MRLLKASDFKRMPWKNGGGETVEIAIHPPGADLAGFVWRISTATVASDGAFSVFEDIDRTLCLLGGAGMDLEIAGLGPRRVTLDSPPLSFPADAATAARLVDGPVTDLNVMTRRGRCRHRVERLSFAEPADVALPGRWNLVLTTGPLGIAAGAFRAEAEGGDALFCEGPVAAVRLSPTGAAPFYRIEIDGF